MNDTDKRKDSDPFSKSVPTMEMKRRGIRTSRPSTSKNRTQSHAPMRDSRSTEFIPPSALLSEESAHRQRTLSLDDNLCLVEVDEGILPINSVQQRSSSSGMRLMSEEDDDDDNIDNEDTSKESYKAVQITRSGTEVRGYVAPSSKQKQLMRKVSGLGMEDPVFGQIADHLQPVHAFNIFDDMSLGDVPEDMRDKLSVVSDRTDMVDLDDDIMDSPINGGKTKEDSGITFSDSWGGFKKHNNNSCSSLPPLGLDPGDSPTKDNRRTLVPKTISTDPPSPTVEDPSKTTRKNQFEAPPNFTPPRGSFLRKDSPKRAQRKLHVSKVMEDTNLAAQVNAMFQNSMPDMAFSPADLIPSQPPPSMHDSFNSPKLPSRRQKSRNSPRNSPRVSVRSSVYVPPGSALAQPSSGIEGSRPKETRRALPSMDSLFPSASALPPPPPPSSSPFRPRTISVDNNHKPSGGGGGSSSGKSKTRKSKKATASNSNSSNNNINATKVKRRGTASTTDLSPSNTTATSTDDDVHNNNNSSDKPIKKSWYAEVIAPVGTK